MGNYAYLVANPSGDARFGYGPDDIVLSAKYRLPIFWLASFMRSDQSVEGDETRPLVVATRTALQRAVARGPNLLAKLPPEAAPNWDDWLLLLEDLAKSVPFLELDPAEVRAMWTPIEMTRWVTAALGALETGERHELATLLGVSSLEFAPHRGRATLTGDTDSLAYDLRGDVWLRFKAPWQPEARAHFLRDRVAAQAAAAAQAWAAEVARNPAPDAVPWSPALRATAGMRLHHPSFGEGIVKEISADGTKATVLFESGPKVLVVGR